MKINPLTCIDFYKADHRRQYPENTQLVYSNLTPRSDNLVNIPSSMWTGNVVNFGLQYFIKHFLQEVWQEGFFKQDKEKVVAEYKRRMDTSLGKDTIPVKHIEKLHDLGYLPIAIRALPEGSVSPIKVASLVIYNTHSDFFWLTNYLETIMSSYLWKPMVSATVAWHYRLLLEKLAKKTGSSKEFIDWQAHDFSFRGMSGPYDAALSGAGHLLSFTGTDSVIAIDLVEQYYNVKAEQHLIGGSVPATEHSVMCMGKQEDELLTFNRLINKLYPSGIVSIVSDTWDFWHVLGHIAKELREAILSREGKVVFRPDSGDPVKIILGDPDAERPEAQVGALELLWNIFGGQTNEKGYRVLNPSVGLIYGDSITPQRMEAILQGMEKKKFSIDCIVFGVGSYTYQYVTRDTLGLAVKSTYGVVDGEKRDIYKCPVTDSGIKHSARGIVSVKRDEKGQFYMTDGCDTIPPEDCEMQLVFEDGELLINESWPIIKERLKKETKRILGQ